MWPFQIDRICNSPGQVERRRPVGGLRASCPQAPAWCRKRFYITDTNAGVMPAFPKAFRSARSHRLGQGVAIIGHSAQQVKRIVWHQKAQKNRTFWKIREAQPPSILPTMLAINLATFADFH